MGSEMTTEAIQGTPSPRRRFWWPCIALALAGAALMFMVGGVTPATAGAATLLPKPPGD